MQLPSCEAALIIPSACWGQAKGRFLFSSNISCSEVQSQLSRQWYTQDCVPSSQLVQALTSGLAYRLVETRRTNQVEVNTQENQLQAEWNKGKSTGVKKRQNDPRIVTMPTSEAFSRFPDWEELCGDLLQCQKKLVAGEITLSFVTFCIAWSSTSLGRSLLPPSSLHKQSKKSNAAKMEGT